MAHPYTPTTYRRPFLQRVRSARTVAGLSPAEIAERLKIPKDTYLRYETRTLLPHHLVEAFCVVTGCNLVWLLTGSHQRADRPGGTDSIRHHA